MNKSEYIERCFSVSDNVNELLKEAVTIVTEFGERTSPRGRETIELTNFTFVLTNAKNGICTLKNRKTSYTLICTEFLMYACGWGREVGHAQLLCDLVPSYSAYRNENTLRFDSPYGPHINGGLYSVIGILQRDRDSRQAVIPIFNAMHSNLAAGGHSKDIACSLNLQFLIRNNCLEMTTNMRSNDLFYGTPHDIAAFTLVQRFIAAVLGVEVGTYTHHTGSLHIYSDKIEKLHEKMEGEETVELHDIDFNIQNKDRKYLLFEEIERLGSLLINAVSLQRTKKQSSNVYADLSKQRKEFDKMLAENNPDLLPLWYGLTGRLIKEEEEE